MIRKVLVIFMLALVAFPALAKSNLSIGSPPPSFKLPDLNGKSVSLETSLGNKVTILSFFASWSKSCKEEMLALQELFERYDKKGVEIIGVSFDRKSTRLEKFIEESNIEFDILHDKKLRTLKDYRILIIPTLFVIDQYGTVKSIYVDFDKNVNEALTQEIKKLLAPPKKG
jgi:peroxiredoxin